RIVGVVLGRLDDFLIANALPHRTRCSPRTLFGAVAKAELKGIYVQPLTQDVDSRLHGESRRRYTRSTIGRRLRFIHYNIEPFDPGIGNIVGSHDTVTGRRDR